MKKQTITIALSILVFSLFLSGCGPGQLLGPTITPSPTSTPIPTSTPTLTPTPTPTPIPVESILLSNGFEVLKENACSDGPCTTYAIKDILMYATYYEDGTLILERVLFSAEDNKKQGTVQKNILYAIYPTDIADVAMGGLASDENGMGKLPYSGEINGYEYGAYAESTGFADPFTGNDIPNVVLFIKPID